MLTGKQKTPFRVFFVSRIFLVLSSSAAITSAVSAVACASSSWSHRASFIYGELATLEVLAVEHRDGVLRLLVR